MPVAVTSYMLATRYDADPDAVAGLVVVSTVVSAVVLPLTLAALL
jgi:predicted permease